MTGADATWAMQRAGEILILAAARYTQSRNRWVGWQSAVSLSGWTRIRALLGYACMCRDAAREILPSVRDGSAANCCALPDASRRL